MRKILVLFLLVSLNCFSQLDKNAFKKGEFLKFKISYGLFNAGFASLEIDESIVKNEPMFHILGKGWSTGMVHLFFEVEDDYQTFINKNTLLPYHFIRKINEGGHTKDKEVYFDFDNQEAKVIDHKHNSEKLIKLENDVQDLLSTLYYLRSLDLSNLKKEDVVSIDMFLDDEIIKFKLIYKGKELINTKFGKVNTLVFNPMVQEGRIFKENESVTLWITNDQNKIPIKIKASVIVGSLKAELVMYKGLANYFPIIFN